ncbi:type II secretion system F family protein [Olsenella sp. HMSC062G07]|uniref:type II secretion system F family protein n=1 Tax=Olsenella sp. HMSC062G07 TaxID=1739330 RepID=UPI0009F2D15B|nr:type II secretion system F family protein [Olsenella sp. HMSC062G07]
MSADELATLGALAALSWVGAFVLTQGGGISHRAERGPLVVLCDAVRSRLLRLTPLEDLRRGRLRRQRRSELMRELPQLLDVVTLGLLSGLSFDASLELYCDRFDGETSALFHEALIGWRMGVGSREEALMAMADELGVTALRRFAEVVSQALHFGAPLASALERQSQAIRDEQRGEVEEEIERVPVRMLIPLGTLVVPAMLLSILGPLLGGAMLAG